MIRLTPRHLRAASFILFLASLPLLSVGTMEMIRPLYWTGLALVAMAGILAPAARFLPAEEDSSGRPDGEFTGGESGRERE